VTYHGVTAFDPASGKMEKPPAHGPTYTQVFGDWIADMATRDTRLVGITPAMREGSGLVRFPSSFQTVTSTSASRAAQRDPGGGSRLRGAEAGGRDLLDLPATGVRPAGARRAIQICPCCSPSIARTGRAGRPHARPGLDVSFLRCIPNLVVMAPADENECRQMLFTGYGLPGPAAVRYPRAPVPG